jgi:internalin A
VRGALLPAPDGATDAAQGATPLQIWDFGGQDLYLGTHALFLRTRAIFPIVWTPAADAAPTHEYAGLTSQNWPLDYWVAYVAQMAGPDRPIVLIQNQVDGPADKRVPPSVPADRLARFAFHRDLAYSARTKRGHATLLDALNQAIEHVHTTEGRTAIGGGWAAVKRALETRREDAGTARANGSADRSLAMMDRAAFDALCATPDVVAAGGVSDTGVLLGYLHQIGTVFHQDHLFDGRIVVDQQWALEAIYAVFERASGVYRHVSGVRGGRFTRPELDRHLWAGLGHGEAEQRLFLDMMVSCGIAFKLRRGDADDTRTITDETELLAPDLLPPEASIQDRLMEVWDDSEQAPTERAVFRYDLLPPGLLRDLMGAIGERAGVAALYWRDGFSFYDGASRSRALVRQVRSETGWAGYIEVLVQRRAGRDGDAGALRDAMIELVAKKQDRLGVKAGVVPEVTRPTGVVAMAMGAIGLGARGPSPRERALIEGTRATARRVGEGRGRPRREDAAMVDGGSVDTLSVVPTAEPQPANAIYVSYAWGSSADGAGPDDRRREQVVDALCEAAVRQGVRVIRDRDVMRFGDSITNFMDQLAEGQKIVVVLSGKYLRSPFCMYELYKIWTECRRRPEVFRQRVRVVALPDATFGDIGDRLSHARAWKQRHDTLKATIGPDWDLLGESDRRAVVLMRNYAADVADILALVADTLNPTRIDDIGKLQLV